MTRRRPKTDARPLQRPRRPRGGRRAGLLARAKARGITGRHRMTVAQLIRALAPPARMEAAAPEILKPSPQAPGRRYEDLPWSYGETELILMAVDPFLIYACWDFSPEDWEGVSARREPIRLRLYDVSLIDFDGTNAHHTFDVFVSPGAQNWYVPVLSAEKSYCADLGWMRPDGSFQTLVRSNVIQTPRAGVSIFEEARWIRPPAARRGRAGRRPEAPADRHRTRRTALRKLMEKEASAVVSGVSAATSPARMRTTPSPQNPA